MAKQVRKLNKRFVTILTVVVMFLMTIVIGILIMGSRNKDPKIYADRAEASMKAGNYLDAISQYNKAYGCSGKDPVWLIKLSDAYYEYGEIPQAMGKLKLAVSANGTLVGAQKRMLELYWEMWNRMVPVNASSQLEEEANRLIKMVPEAKVQTDPESRKTLALGYHMRGLARYARRSEDAKLLTLAKEDLTKAVSLEPDPEYVQTLAMIPLEDAQRMAQLAGAENITPEAFDDYIGKMYGSVGQAEELYLSLGKVPAPGTDEFITIGNFYFRIWGAVENVVGGFCQFQQRRLSNGLLEIQQQIEDVERSKVATEEKRRLRQRMNNQLLEIRQQIPAWTKRGAEHKDKLEACYNKAEKYYVHALELAKGSEQKVDAQLSLADYYLTMKKLPEAQTYARQAVAEDPKGFRQYRQLAVILKQQTAQEKGEKASAKIDEAIKALNQRLDMPKETVGIKGKLDKYQRADLSGVLAEFYLDRQKGDDLAKADTLIKELENQSGETAMLCQLKAARAMASQDYTGAIIQLEKADKLSNERNGSVKLMLGEMYYRTGNLGAAKKAVETGLSLSQGAVAGLRLAMAINLRLGEVREAIRYANILLSMPGMDKDGPALKVKLEGLVREGQLNDADRVAKLVSQADKEFNWPVEKSRILIQQNKAVEAEQLLLEVLGQKPGDRTASIYLVDLYSKQNKITQAQEVLKAALAKTPDDEGLKRLDAVMMVSDPKERAVKLREMSTAMAEKSMETALAQAKEEKDPFVRSVMLVDQYLRRDDMAEAQKWLDEAVKLDPKRANDMNFRFALIRQDWDRAQRCVTLAREHNLDSVGGLMYEAKLANAKGWEQVNKGQMDQAGAFFDQSVKSASQVVEKLSNDAESRALLGEGYWWLDRRSEGSTEISRAMSLNPNNAYALRARSVELWDKIASGAVTSDEANNFSQNLQQAYSQMPWDPWLKGKVDWLKSRVTQQREFQEDEQGDAAKVVARREEIRAKDPKNTENLMRLAWIYENREGVRDLDKAQKCYQQVLEQNQTADSLAQYAAFAQRNNKLAEVEPFLKGLAESLGKTGKGSGYSLLGYYYMMARDAAKAETAFSEAVNVEDVAGKRMDMAVYYVQASNVDKAIEWSHKALEAGPTGRQERSIRSMLINALLTSSRWDDVKKEIEIFVSKYANDPEGRIYQAKLAAGQGSLSESESILGEILSKNPDYIEALDLQSKLYLYRWDLEKSRVDLERMQTVNPGAFGVAGQISLGKLYCEMGRSVEAEQLARKLIQDAGKESGEWLDRIRTDLIPSLSSSLDEKQFEDLLTWAGNTYRGYWGWSYERGRFFMLKKKYRQAQQAFSETWTALAKAPIGMRLSVLDSYFDAQFKAQSYNDLLKLANEVAGEIGQEPFLIGCWKAAAYLGLGQEQKGLEVYVKALASEKNPLLIWQMTKNSVLKAIDPRTLASALSQRSESMGAQVALACSYFAAKDYARGDAIYRQLFNTAKDSQEKMVYLYVLGQEYTEKNQYNEAVAVFEEMNKLDPENLAVLNNLAYILGEYQGKAAEALKLMTSKFMAMSTNPDLLDTYGQLMVKTGKLDEGLYYTAKSVWIRDSAASRYHLGKILLEQKRRTEAGIQFKRALQLVGDDAVLEKAIQTELDKL